MTAELFTGLAQGFYTTHYKEAISPYLTFEQKQDIAKRISNLTLQSPIWQDKDANYIEQFPELKGKVNVSLSGLYLCAILQAIVDDISTQNKVGLCKEKP